MPNKDISAKQEKEYVASKAIYCPHCGSVGLESSTPVLGDMDVSVEVNCGNCNESWTEIYELSGILEAATTPPEKTFVALHHHKHGEDVAVCKYTPTLERPMPGEKAIAKACEFDLETDGSEYIESIVVDKIVEIEES